MVGVLAQHLQERRELPLLRVRQRTNGMKKPLAVDQRNHSAARSLRNARAPWYCCVGCSVLDASISRTNAGR